MPSLDQAWVAGFGERVGSKVGAYQKSIRSCPAEVRFRLRQLEPVGDEFACQHVEFTHGGRIRATAGEADQSARVLWFDDVWFGPHPVFVIGARQLIYGDQNIPVGGIAAVAF